MKSAALLSLLVYPTKRGTGPLERRASHPLRLSSHSKLTNVAQESHPLCLLLLAGHVGVQVVQKPRRHGRGTPGQSRLLPSRSQPVGRAGLPRFKSIKQLPLAPLLRLLWLQQWNYEHVQLALALVSAHFDQMGLSQSSVQQPRT